MSHRVVTLLQCRVMRSRQLSTCACRPSFETGCALPPTTRELERDALGYPLEWAARWQHAGARNEFIGVMNFSDVPRSEWIPLVKKYDAEDPGFYVEWLRLRQDEHAARESEGRRGAA